MSLPVQPDLRGFLFLSPRLRWNRLRVSRPGASTNQATRPSSRQSSAEQVAVSPHLSPPQLLNQYPRSCVASSMPIISAPRLSKTYRADKQPPGRQPSISSPAADVQAVQRLSTSRSSPKKSLLIRLQRRGKTTTLQMLTANSPQRRRSGGGRCVPPPQAVPAPITW